MHALTLCLPLLLAPLAPDDTLAVPPDTVTVAGTYAIDIEYPNIFVLISAFLTGIEPDSVTYEERWLVADSTRRWLCSTMIADGSEVWFRVDADTAAESFTDFPGEDRVRIVADALSVLPRFIAFLSDSTRIAFSGTFSHRWKPLTIEAHAENPPLPDVRSVTVTAVSAAGPYLTGTIVVERRNGENSYPLIRALFHERDIAITLTARTRTVTRSNE